MSAEYRIVRDSYNGFEAQFRPWWSPFWFQCGGCNTSESLERAEEICRSHVKPVVKYLGRLSGNGRAGNPNG